MVGKRLIQNSDQLAAHALLSELRTRIATQPLPYQHGIEARALESLWEIFALARKAMKDNPGCENFARLATNMLNVDLRPFTAKWHQAYKSGVLESRDGANSFRIELIGVQARLVSFSAKLQELAYGSSMPDETAVEVMNDLELNKLFLTVPFGIGHFSNGEAISKDRVEEINKSESEAISRRRAHYSINVKNGSDAVGLALSGGGIRSATFCLGVVQVLAERGLIKDVDYISTVSGGGYVGSLITSTIGGSRQFSELANPHGPDTSIIRHVRQNAKYLSAANLKQRWLMVTGTLAGLLLNWTALLGVVAVVALAFSFLDSTALLALLTNLVAILTMLSLVLVLFYGVSRRIEAVLKLADALLASATIATVTALAFLAVEHGYMWFLRNPSWNWWSSSAIVGASLSVPTLVRFLPLVTKKKTRELVFKVALAAAGLAVPIVLILTFYFLRELAVAPADANLPFWNPLHHISGQLILALLTTISAFFAIFPLNINLTGPHKLYRDRLANTFVHLDSEKSSLPLFDTNAHDQAPYHLINTAINLPNSTSPTLRDRRCDFFLFSKYWTGSPAVGYWETKAWKSDSQQIDLATAMAISGAAASPHMGLASMPSLASIMTLLNIRLGYWITRPDTRSGTPGFMCLMKEMAGFGMAERSRWLNLSDGGHIENMGVYELLRRRCKFIVCVDGEADRESTFHGQLTLVRHAQIDFGVQIEPRLEEIRQDAKSRLSRSHFHLFRVHYPENGSGEQQAVGLLLYLKLSLTGDESELLKRYRSISADFPHEPTLDQFYDEEQFEVYRQLGVHVAEGAFSSALMIDNKKPNDTPAWFRQLAKCLLEPSNA
jgi:uncharacterized membrane protein YkvI